MDQFSAHLDRGWDLVQRGDSQGAEISARRALEIDNQSPEAYNLLGYVCALQGEFEDAIDSYRQALALDDTYLEAMLNAAELYIHPLGDLEEAIRLCEMALDLVENEDELVDALLLKFDALLGLGRTDEARALSARFPTGPFESATHAFLVGRAFFEIGDVEAAIPLVEAAARAHPPNAEAFYYLGLIRDERGDADGATQSFLKARELDADQPSPSWSLTREAFLLTVRRAIELLPAELAPFLHEADVYVAEAPGVEVVVDGVDPRALLLIDTLASPGEGEPPLPRVFVYQRNVERIAGALERVEGEVRAALEREAQLIFLEPEPEGPRVLN
jgi:Flp pilus assembly protein TadD